MRQRFRDASGNTVEPAVLNEGDGPYGCFIVRDRHGFTLTAREEPYPRTMEAVAALGIDTVSLVEVR